MYQIFDTSIHKLENYMSPEMFIKILSMDYLKINFNLQKSNIFSIGLLILKSLSFKKDFNGMN